MSIENKNPFENYKPRITPLDVLKAVGGMAYDLVSMHQLSTRSDHFQHPLDDVFDKPPYSQDSLLNANLSGFGYETEE